eukprot:CAMPEP_0204835654 /NCGR_PEP_ID=MMETSP1346-20131115/23223_1 /ASSEMBLY_ACC=CAM_ASM_000771 /TAXON_ID=215587 /ORGANISM="Aplanochytrium stocchinoi, Strain GSBS06" /LENGTH=371 /DNA_ID=CAMNT_0051969847 /DNA_START=38 /DNA_END=1150 /DNA_ORIENTATION=+
MRTQLASTISEVQTDDDASSNSTGSFSSIANGTRLARVLFLEMDHNSAMFSNIVAELVECLKGSLDNPYKLVRHEIGSTIALLLDKVALSGHEPALTCCRDLFDVICKQAVPGKPNIIETAMSLVSKLSKLGGHECYIIPLLPVIFYALDSSDLDLNKLAKGVAGLIAINMGQMGVEAIKVLKIIGLEASVWQWRLIATEMTDVIVTRQGALIGLPACIHARKAIEKMLYDPQSEVQKTAANSLLKLLTSLHAQSESLEAVVKKYEKLASLKLLKKDEVEEEKYLKRQKQRHVGVLGLSSVVRAFPYSIPFPSSVIILSLKNNERGPVGSDAKGAVEEFKRTHHDTWETDKLVFSQDELEYIDYSPPTAGY